MGGKGTEKSGSFKKCHQKNLFPMYVSVAKLQYAVVVQKVLVMAGLFFLLV